MFLSLKRNRVSTSTCPSSHETFISQSNVSSVASNLTTTSSTSTDTNTTNSSNAVNSESSENKTEQPTPLVNSESRSINTPLVPSSDANNCSTTLNSISSQSLDNFNLLRRTSNRCLLQWKPNNRTDSSSPPGVNSKSYIFRNMSSKQTSNGAVLNNAEEKRKNRTETEMLCYHGDAAVRLDVVGEGKNPILDAGCDNAQPRNRKLCPFSFRRALKSALFAASIPLPPHNRKEWPYLKFRKEKKPEAADMAILSSNTSSSSSSEASVADSHTTSSMQRK